MRKILLLVVSSIFFMLSCRENEENTVMNVPINAQMIGKGNMSVHYVSQQNTVITNTTDWNSLLADINTANNTSGSFTETNIDFNQFMVIAVFDEVYLNGGHSIDIITVTETSQNIEVDVEKLLHGNATSVVTQPYHIIKIPKSAKPVVFQ